MFSRKKAQKAQKTNRPNHGSVLGNLGFAPSAPFCGHSWVGGIGLF